jgi:hypothetical protein
MEKLSKEQAEAVIGIFNGWTIDVKGCTNFRKAIENITEEEPEDELAEYKCPRCGEIGLEIYSNEDEEYRVMCQDVGCGFSWQNTSFFLGISRDVADYACYQPEWNGGKK